MNLDSLSFALSQISYSVANLSKKNYKSSVAEISHLLSRHGAEADRHLFRCLFSHVDFSGDGHISGKDIYQIQYLTQECSSLIAKPNFVSILCSSIDNPLHHQKSIKPSPHLLLQLSKVLKLNRIQEVCFGIALLNSGITDTRLSAISFTRSRLPQLINTYLDTEAIGNLDRRLPDLSAEVLHLILTHLTADYNNFGVKPEQKESFISKLQLEFPKDRVPVILAPLLYCETADLGLEQLNPDALTTPTGIMATSLADTVREIGYGFTSSVEECRNDLRQLGVREITPPSIARVLGMMAKSPMGLGDPISVQALGAVNNQWLDLKESGSEGGPQAWNVDVFVQAVKDLAPHLPWRDVIAELDHPGFLILSKAGLRLIVQALFRGVLENFPIDLIYKPWKNTEGQLAFIAHAIKNPDVFCFADYPCHAVNLEQLKTPPDEENRDIATWKSLDLVETLLRLSEAGHYSPVSELFKFPVQHCPDLFVFSLLQIHTWNRMKHELLSLLMPVFLGNHPNSGNVLNYAWHIQGQSTTIRTLIMHTMAEWYMRGDIYDQTRLSRILDIAQDLKALSMLLSASPFAFVIDLACLASRREYLKLEKWLTDKIREHGEPFIQECILFLKRRCPQIMPNGPMKEEAIKGAPLTTDVIGTILRCLQSCYNQNLSQETQEAIMSMLHNAPNLMAGRGPPQGPSGAIQGSQAQHKPGLPGLPNSTTAPSIPANPMDPLGGSNGPIGPGGPTTHQSGLTSLTNSLPGAPGSPAKAFPTVGNPVGQLTQQFNPVQNLASQLQNLSMNTGLGSNMASQGLGGNLGSLGGNLPSQNLSGGLGTSMTTPSLTGGLGNNMTNQGIAGGLGNNMTSQSLGGLGTNMISQSLSGIGTNMTSQSLGGIGNSMTSQGLGGIGNSMTSQGLGGIGTSMTSQGLGGIGTSMTSQSLGGIGTSMTSQSLGGIGTSMTSQSLGGIGSNMHTQASLSGSGSGGPGSLSGTPTKNNPFQTGLNLGGGGGLGSLGPSVGSLAPPQATGTSRMHPELQSLHDRLNAQKGKAPLGAPATTQAPSSSVGVGGGDVSNIFPAMNQQFPKEIEDEANSYFQRIYNHATMQVTISIDEVLDMLRRFKDSPQKKERDVFACMLRNLFEEYRFFPQYPDKELHTTAVLFGGIIEQGLVTYMDLGIALRYVLEALKKPHGSKMYYFGIAALDRFKTRLKDYPQYCQHLASIPHFTQFPQHLREYIEFGARSQEPPNRPQGSVPSPSPVPIAPTASVAATSTSTVTTTVSTTVTAVSSITTSTTTSTAASHGAIARPGGPSTARTSIATATNIDTLIAGQEGLNEEVIVPPESVQDKVFFIFNNLSIANMDQKAKELKESMEEKMYPWAGQYLVMKRASIEHNFHTLYAKFIDHLKLNNFLKLVVDETFRNIRVLLRSDKGVANFSDRSLLKNLGHWLGMLTLAKNKPILCQDIDLKSLLYESFHKGAQELLYVVPFVAKVLESCAQSKVFKPPNPWTMGIMNVLAELHQVPDLKLNLKFEIEVLCKNLIIDINDLHPGTYLIEEERLTYLDNQLSAPRKGPETSTPQPEEPLQINMPTPTTTVAASTPAQTVTTTSTTTTSSIVPPTPQFGYHEINVMSLSGLAPHINVPETIALLQGQPQLKQLIRPAVERSVQELLPPVVERSIKIALTTCEQIVKKDFALDPEENRMCVAAHNMVRFMTSGMALITCREPLLVSITNNVKQAFLSTLRGATPAQKDTIEAAATSIAQDNVDLACVFIQKTAIEKAIPEMDKRLTKEYELRKHARSEGRRYCDPLVLTYQAERMPEQIRLKVGGVTHQQIAVYEEFSQNIPGFVSTKQEQSQHAPSQQASGNADECSQIYEKLAHEIDSQLRTMAGASNNPLVIALHNLLEAVILARNTREIVTALALLQKAVEGLLDGLTALPNDAELMLRYRDCHLLVLKGLQDQRAYGPQWTNKQVTRCLIDCREEYKYNIEAVDVLIKSHLVTMQQYDMHLATSMENGLNYMAVAFSMQLIQRFCVEEKGSSGNGGAQENAYQTEFYNTIETLARIASHSRQAPEGLTSLIEAIRQQNDGGLMDRVSGGPTSMMHSGISQAREFDDPPGLHDKTEFLLKEWVNLYHSPAAGRDSTRAFSSFVGQMHQHGILKTDELITRFFRLCTEMCTDLCYRALSDPAYGPPVVRTKCFYTLDAFVRLIALLVKHSGDTSNTVTKINLLNKVLGIVAGVLLQDHEVRHTDFQQMPYHRIFIMLFIELNAPEHVLENINYQVLTAFCNTFHILRPSKAPGFSYAWLELISHRVFIGRMLAITPQQRGWNMYAQLLIDLYKFLSPFLRNAELSKPTQLLYKGTLRVLLVLLHDFPEFLCDYHYAFCDVILPNCIQMRNLILSAFPRNMRLPDPFTPNLKVDMLPEIAHQPRIMTNFANNIQPANFKKDLDSYLKARSPVTFLSELRSNLQLLEPSMRYNIPLINALVLYVGTQAITHIHSKGLTPSMSTIAHSSHMDIFQNLAVDLDTEGRYLFLNAIANQLRYPNSHTHYFSCTLLYLFAEANNETIQEQITRVLLERLIVNRPHPWGLLITFIELIKNPQFKFWNHEFVHCAPEIEKLFESVAKSCMQTRQQAPMLREEGQPQQLPV